MYVRQVKRKCNVRGCKNIECFAISQTREVGNTVIICKSCLSSALESLDEINPKTKSNIPVNNALAPTLFYNAHALGDKKAVSDIPPASLEEAGTDEVTPPAGSVTPPASSKDVNEKTEADTDTEPAPATDEYICPKCGKEFDSIRGLQTHTRYCEPQNEE